MKISASETGAINVLLVPLVMSVVLFVVSLGFGAWAYTSREDYKNNSDEKAATAVAVAVERTKTEKDNEFLEREKEPLKTYSGPSQYGSVNFKYPKTWSAYSIEQNETMTLLLQPDVVPSNPKSTYALKVEVLNTEYRQAINSAEQQVKQGKATAAAFNFQKVPGVTGLRFDGQLDNEKRGASIYVPLRDKTLRVSSETPERVNDFNTIILPNFTFSP